MANVFKRNLLIEKVGEFFLEITSVQVKGETRALRVSWTPELSQDLDYYNNSYEPEESKYVYKKILLTEKYIPKKLTGFDCEAELAAELSRNLAQEIDREILGNLYNLYNE